jgi:hypothetical protein
MSIILHVSKFSDKSEKDETSEITDNTNVINIPRDFKTKRNDLSALELSITSSKYTLSGDDMTLSNLSFDSHSVMNTKNTHEDNEIIIQSQSGERASYMDKILNSSAGGKDNRDTNDLRR